MATKTEINFTELIDLSLGTPEVVNYKGLRVLLAAIVSQLGVNVVNLELSDYDRNELNAVKEAKTNEQRKDKNEVEPKTNVQGKGKNEVEAKTNGQGTAKNKGEGKTNDYEQGPGPGTGKNEVEAKTNEQGQGTGKKEVPTRPTTGTGGGGLRQSNEMDKSKSASVTFADGSSSGSSGSGGSVPQIIQDMEMKMSKIEGQLDALNSLPSNESLMARTQSVTSEDGKKTTPVSDMWQLMQCQRKATANEEGISKLMSMMEDMMRELRGMNEKLDKHSSDISDLQNKHADLENKHEDLQKNIEKLNDYNKTAEERLSKLETSSGDQEKLDEIQKLLDLLRSQLATLPSAEEIVTWPDFEAALKGAYKEPISQLDSGMQTAPLLENTQIQTVPQHDAYVQTVTPTPPTPSPPASRPISSRSVRSGVSTGSIHPSNELQKVLKELGELTGRHNLLEDRVKGLEELLAKKADMSEVEALLAQWNVPADLVAKLAELEEGLNHLRDSKAKDSQSLADLENALAQLQAEVDKLNSSYMHLVDEHNVKQKHIDALYTFVDRLQENKADKEHVVMEIDVKADKRALDNKVSRSQFDGTVDELSKNLHDVMDKLAGHKMAWDSAVGELRLDIDNKLDRMELDPLKSYLDSRIKSVSSKMVRKEVETGEDAAGFRRPLQKFHCISCDRPLDIAPQQPIPSLPENKALPGSRSGRPYTTFELEQIRAAQKNGQYQDVPDYFVTSRSCGGSHTLTYPHRRITRIAQMTNMVTTTEEVAPVVTGRLEADIEGQDGHIYKARLDPGHMTERLPTLTPIPKTPSTRVKSPRISSARGRRTNPATRQSVEPTDNNNNSNALGVAPPSVGQRPMSARGPPHRPTSARWSNSSKSQGRDSPGGRRSPAASPPNTVVEQGGGSGGEVHPPPQRDPQTETITVPHPPQEAS